MPTKTSQTATEILARLKRHYINPGDPLPGGMFLPEATHPAGRRADALYIGFTRSRGHLLIGHEIKVSRADWLHELDQIQKAEVWLSQCQAFYLVVPDASIVMLGELPHGWGLMVPDPRTKTRMKILEKATVYEDRHPDWPTTHAILKRADTLRLEMAHQARDAERKKVADELDQLRQRAYSAENNTSEHLVTELARTKALVADVAEILGLKTITQNPEWRWADDPDDAIAVEELRTQFARFVRAGRDADRALRYRTEGLERLRQDLERAVESVAGAEKTMKGLA